VVGVADGHRRRLAVELRRGKDELPHRVERRLVEAVSGRLDDASCADATVNGDVHLEANLTTEARLLGLLGIGGLDELQQ
jgi:hypothetical protein